MGSFRVLNVNTEGGILIFWDKMVVEKVEVFSRKFMVSYQWCNIVDGFKWAFGGVNGPNGERLRRILR